MFSVHDGQVWSGERALGPDTALIAAPAELPSLNESDGVIHTATPYNIDLLFAVGDRVAGGESKRPPDLVRSHADGRLGRQVATLIDTVDIPFILCRGGFDLDTLIELGLTEASYRDRWEIKDFWQDMAVRFPALGVYVVDVPDLDLSVRHWLKMYREAWLAGPQRAVVRRESGPKERRPGWLLRRVPSIGAKRSVALHELYGSTYGVFNAVVHEQVHPPSVQRALEEALA